MIVCVAEDRRTHETALRVLLHSFYHTNPHTEVVIFAPDPSPSFEAWVKRYPNFKLRFDRVHSGKGWAIKPAVLLCLLDDGYDEIVWLDSDIFVNGSLKALLSSFGSDVLVVAEEALAGQARRDPDSGRARAWGFHVGRRLEGTVNTCVLRINARHRGIIKEWKSLMENDIFRNAQRLDFADRPVHLASDQDVLTALLTSSEFSSLRVGFVRRGKQILQYYGLHGFTTWERLRVITLGLPALIHSQASAPWARFAEAYVWAVFSDVSPYVLLAKRISYALDGDKSWLQPRTRLGSVMRVLGFGFPSLTGLPVSLLSDLLRLVMKVVRVST